MPRAALAPRSSTLSTLRLVVTARVCQLSVRPSGTSPFECGLRQALFVGFQLDALRGKNTLDERTLRAEIGVRPGARRVLRMSRR